jgi:hypothetical protein
MNGTGDKMTIDPQDLLNSILASLDRIDYIKTDEIPNIDLYMDQVTTFMDTHMSQTARRPKEDKILTKTMINNYAKNDLLPPPVKKKYSKEHMLVLIFIYYFKGILSIGDIQSLLRPVTERFFGKDDSFKLEDVYNEVFRLEADQVERLKEDVRECYRVSQQTFQEAPEESREFLQQFAYICMLSFDVYTKKLLIEKLIDGLFKEAPKDGKAQEKAAKENKKTDAKENRKADAEDSKNSD